MTEKKKFNWSMLDALGDEFRNAIKARFGEKGQWMGGSIAAAAYLAMSEQDRERWVNKIALANASDEELDKLLASLGVRDEPVRAVGNVNPPGERTSTDPAKTSKRPKQSRKDGREVSTSGRAK